MERKLKSAVHHWWPQSLSGFWATTDGCVTQLRFNGDTVRSPPKNFGGISNAHALKFGGEDTPWNASFERVLDTPDNQFPDLINWLSGLQTKPLDESLPLVDRFLQQPITEQRKLQLAQCLASLVARSPVSRNLVKLTTEEYRRRMGLPVAGVDKTLIAANLQYFYGSVAKAIDSGGKFLILFAEAGEFIFGDGFLHNFVAQSINHSNVRLLVALTPKLAVLYIKPMSYRPYPEMVTLRASASDVMFVNDTTQVYSSNFVFYRNDAPRQIDAFRLGEFRQYVYHEHEFLDYWVDVLSNYSLPRTLKDG